MSSGTVGIKGFGRLRADGLPDIDTPATQDTLIGGVAVAFGQDA